MWYHDSLMGGWGWNLFGFVFQLELVIIGALLVFWLWKKVR